EPACPWTWVTSRWLVDAAAAEGFDVEWVPISLDHLNGDDEHRIGLLAGRVAQHLRETVGNDAAGRFYEAWGRRFHAGGEPEEAATVVAAARDVGVDATAVVDDDRYDAAIGGATDAAVAA